AQPRPHSAGRGGPLFLSHALSPIIPRFPRPTTLCSGRRTGEPGRFKDTGTGRGVRGGSAGESTSVGEWIAATPGPGSHPADGRHWATDANVGKDQGGNRLPPP